MRENDRCGNDRSRFHCTWISAFCDNKNNPDMMYENYNHVKCYQYTVSIYGLSDAHISLLRAHSRYGYKILTMWKNHSKLLNLVWHWSHLCCILPVRQSYIHQYSEMLCRPVKELCVCVCVCVCVTAVLEMHSVVTVCSDSFNKSKEDYPKQTINSCMVQTPC